MAERNNFNAIGVKRKGFRLIFSKKSAKRRKEGLDTQQKQGAGLLAAGVLGGIASGFAKTRGGRANIVFGSTVSAILGGQTLAQSTFAKRDQKDAESKRGVSIPKGVLGGLGVGLLGALAGFAAPGTAFKLFRKGLGKTKQASGKFAARKAAKRQASRKAGINASRQAGRGDVSRGVKGTVQDKSGKNIRFIRVRGRVIPIGQKKLGKR